MSNQANRSEIVQLPVNSLVFDPENPRLPSTVRAKKNSPEYENEVIDWMLQFENVTELMGSIGEKGYFAAEPILVVENTKGLYEVVEGNRRLTAVKLLNSPSKAVKRKNTIREIVDSALIIPKVIPSIIFDTRDEVLSYLGYKHITGVQPWDSLAKARYLKQLKETLNIDEDFNAQCRRLAKMIGSKAPYVRLLLLGVEIYEKIEQEDFYHISGLNEESFEFGVFYTALGRDNISKYLGIDLRDSSPLENIQEEKLKDLTTWIFEKNDQNATRLGESRNLKYLNKILDVSYPDALSAFKSGRSLEDSVKLTNQPEEVFNSSLNDALLNLKIARDYLHQIKNPSKSSGEILLEIAKISRVMRNAIEDMIFENEDIE